MVSPKSVGSALYAATKAAVNSLVETTAIENAPTVRIDAVLPGVVQTKIMPVNDATYQAIASKMQLMDVRDKPRKWPVSWRISCRMKHPPFREL